MKKEIFKNHRGFTLIELMITIAIAAILITVAIPGFQTFIENNRVTTQINNLVSAINLARLEAIKRGSPATVCISTDGATCTGGGDWTGGWIFFSDRNGNGAVDGTNCGNAATDDCILKVWGGLSSGTNLDNVAQTIVYNPDGRLAGGANFTLGIEPAHCQSNQRKSIQIIPSGRPEVTELACL